MEVIMLYKFAWLRYNLYRKVENFFWKRSFLLVKKHRLWQDFESYQDREMWLKIEVS
jgi:hypothetical protein